MLFFFFCFCFCFPPHPLLVLLDSLQIQIKMRIHVEIQIKSVLLGSRVNTTTAKVKPGRMHRVSRSRYHGHIFTEVGGRGLITIRGVRWGSSQISTSTVISCFCCFCPSHRSCSSAKRGHLCSDNRRWRRRGDKTSYFPSHSCSQRKRRDRHRVVPWCRRAVLQRGCSPGRNGWTGTRESPMRSGSVGLRMMLLLFLLSVVMVE